MGTGRVQAEILNHAAQVIAESGPRKPADQVLRDRLRQWSSTLPQEQRASIRDAVFCWYRWCGAQEKEMPGPTALKRALSRQDQFDKNPGSISWEELRAEAIPAWIADHVKVSEAWVRSLQREPVLWLRAQQMQTQRVVTGLRDARPAAVAKPFGGCALAYEGSEDLFRTPEFQEGAFEIQDLVSQAVGWLCGARPGETWWDVCAGEGGKTLHLGDMMDGKGLIWATDTARWRLQRLKRRAARAGLFHYRMAHWVDWQRAPIKTKFDGILVDAPCSGVGTWQRNPHARWTTNPQDVAELAAKQRHLLRLAERNLKPGGRLVYSVCTLTREETDDVADFVDREIESLKPCPAIDPWKQNAVPQSRLWLWPQETDGNGMFVAVWRKAGAG